MADLPTSMVSPKKNVAGNAPTSIEASPIPMTPILSTTPIVADTVPLSLLIPGEAGNAISVENPPDMVAQQKTFGKLGGPFPRRSKRFHNLSSGEPSTTPAKKPRGSSTSPAKIIPNLNWSDKDGSYDAMFKAVDNYSADTSSSSDDEKKFPLPNDVATNVVPDAPSGQLVVDTHKESFPSLDPSINVHFDDSVVVGTVGDPNISDGEEDLWMEDSDDPSWEETLIDIATDLESDSTSLGCSDEDDFTNVPSPEDTSLLARMLLALTQTLPLLLRMRSSISAQGFLGHDIS